MAGPFLPAGSKTRSFWKLFGMAIEKRQTWIPASTGMTKNNDVGNDQKSPSSKAAAGLTRGAYFQYVSTAKWRERRWRLFSTFLL
jgi:hypothetical protein